MSNGINLEYKGSSGKCTSLWNTSFLFIFLESVAKAILQICNHLDNFE